MTTPRRQLTREQAFGLLEDAGFPTGTFPTNTGVRVPFLVVQVAVAGAESDLVVSAEGPPNSNGTIDRGWLQINSVHGYDEDLLLSDPDYTAAAAFDVLARQGLNAWAAYTARPYAKRLPPCYGGPELSRAAATTNAREVVRTVQQRINELKLAGIAPLVVDGAYGAKSEAAVSAFQRGVKLPVTGRVDGDTWLALGVR